MNIALIAGTPFDTQMGMNFLKTQGYDSRAYPISKTPDEQSKLQILYPDRLREMVIEKIKEIKREKIKNIYIHCNSLSGAVDMDKLKEEYEINIITPLQIYREMANQFDTIGVLAANNQSTFGIERTIQEINPKAYVIGIGILPLVNAIEKGLPVKDIVEDFALEKTIEFFIKNNCEAIILGCTHFPYLYKELQAKSSVKIIDPAMEMIKKLI
ncbi:aspartate/glutamate racemase family protein [Clostridium tetani]|uniref:aspartate/glutamate racemase family protein n=1 Tax=Clostridium tetani TaxID=1513 RepID=UPI00100BE5F4|nr:aspartate/glutamate racemase family protein [Clostridium tetani]RXM59064.1 Asp/Glu/hydantoin racemase [Clostridium tetani]RXM77706.1 Asp/Glu/hydantoin racemase [Clostridium tetani]RYU99638.1 Asp/Glu/hydantoin racemase [Clostridium tetani]